MNHLVQVRVNGKIYKAEVPSQKTLLEFLTEDLGLSGLSGGCGKGECGKCIVILNGRAVNACLTLVVEVDGEDIMTFEGR